MPAIKWGLKAVVSLVKRRNRNKCFSIVSPDTRQAMKAGANPREECWAAPIQDATRGRISIIVADKSVAIREILRESLERSGFAVRTTCDPVELRAWSQYPQTDLVIADESVLFCDQMNPVVLSEIAADMPLIVTRANANAPAEEYRHPGLCGTLLKPFDIKSLIELCERAVGAPDPLIETDVLPLLGKSRASKTLYRYFRRLARTDYPVLIQGEAGTGADLVAKALHKSGRRRCGPYLEIDAAGFDGKNLGEFLGATKDSQDQGLASRARGGSVYLEEIADLPFDAQARLARLLKLLGREKNEGPRVIASTSKNLPTFVAQGAFRQDLFYRLNVMPLHLPPLRTRLEDLPDIVGAMLNELRDEGLLPGAVHPTTLQRLEEYDWPGNILELSNFLRRIVVLYDGEITADVVHAELARSVAPRSITVSAPPTPTLAGAVENYLSSVLDDVTCQPPGLYSLLLREIETPLLRRILDVTHGNKLKAAEMLGLNRNTLRKKLEKLGM